MAQNFIECDREQLLLMSPSLREWLPGKSWGQIRRLMKGRQVMVSGNLCVDAGRRLKLQDVVKVLPQPAAPPPRADDIKIRYLDEHVVVVEKQAGMTSNRHKEEEHWPAKRKQLSAPKMATRTPFRSFMRCISAVCIPSVCACWAMSLKPRT